MHEGDRVVGGFGDAVICKNLKDQQLYVAKRNKEAKHDAGASLEMQFMLKVKHAHVLRVKEGFWSPAEKGLVMLTEYCPLGSLEGQLKARMDKKESVYRLRKFSEPLVRICLHDMLQGLCHLSAHKMAHCDIKPANLLMSDAGDRFKYHRLVIADFGVSRLLAGSEEIRTHPIGTPRFFSPELKCKE